MPCFREISTTNCAPQAKECVIAEAVRDGLAFSLFDPLRGRGRSPVQTAPFHSNVHGWSLSADGKKLSWVAKSNTSRIETLDIQTGAKSAIELKGWQVETLSWAPDNAHFYVSGGVGLKSTISLVGLDGQIKDIVTSVPERPWPFMAKPSPDGRYLGFNLISHDANVVKLENF
jgi:hypothetical protein